MNAPYIKFPLNAHSVAEAPALYLPDLVAGTDRLRLETCRQLAQHQRAELGQFLTPAPVARLMASMLRCDPSVVSLLDAGAGIGSLFAACVSQLCEREHPPTAIYVTAYEIDPLLLRGLAKTVENCRQTCAQAGIAFTAEVRPVDFIQEASALIGGDLFASPLPPFTAAILNPPYRKIHTDSEEREALRRIGIETSNLYTGFLALAGRLLMSEGEMVTITPRSFCNGTYFRSFREEFLREMALQRIHLFDSRTEAFRDDAVLQETIILHATRNHEPPSQVMITTSAGAEDEFSLSRTLPYAEVVHPDDPEQFIRVVSDGMSQQIVARMARFQTTSSELGLTISTGRVVDFRAKSHLRDRPEAETAPLLYPVNLENGTTVWPRPTRKPQALFVCKETELLLVPNETYVLVKRFSSKEQARRVVAAVFEGGKLPGKGVGFENHLNYFHQKGQGLDLLLAKGLSVYLNSTLVDAFFRQFNGHTQVNATDLRSLKYPTLSELVRLGERLTEPYPTQEQIDTLMTQEFFSMADNVGGDPIASKKRLQEAVAVLSALGLPHAQVNERSALTLLALLDLPSARNWNEASSPLCGITPMMDFMEREFGKRYAPNSRETVRRQTVHQFLGAGLVIANPDDPDRPINSGKTVYQIEASALGLLRTYGTPEWEQNLKAYLASAETLKARYSQEREMQRIPVEIAPGKTITLSPGGQNVLVEQIIQEFAPRFTPGGTLLYVGDADTKFAHFDSEALSALNVSIDPHGKMPDVIIHYATKNWLVLIEAVTSHGPINPKRKAELESLFHGSTAGLVLVTAFLSRKVMGQYLADISWETEVWTADAPTHMIHFNGERFLGPYA